MSPMAVSPHASPSAATRSSGGRLVTADGRSLPLRSCSLEVDASGGLARVVVRHVFFNDASDPLQVTFQLPLPSDGAVGAYSFVVGDRRVVGEIDRRESARERYEEAILEGRSAALLEQDRSALFTQEIGNIPPLTEVTCELVVDQKLRWLEDGQWEWRFPTVVAPRYLGAEGKVPDGERVIVDVSEQPLPAHITLALTIRDALAKGAPTSPTHPLVARKGESGYEIALASEGGAALDRDIAVRWTVAQAEAGVMLAVSRPPTESKVSESAFGLLTITPPAPEAGAPALPRDLIILIDTSGSMSGQPLELAKAVALKVIESLDPNDQLEMIEFSSAPHHWRKAPCAADGSVRAAASSWIHSLKAGGGTEMESGVRAALSTLRPEAQRQVLLITDGLVGFESTIVGLARKATGRGTRVHTVGIGSASNRSLTTAVARAGGGGEFIIALDENVDDAAARIVARLSTPLVVGLRVGGSALLKSASESLPDLLGGAPSLVPVQLKPGGGELVIEGRTVRGSWSRRITVAACEAGSGCDSIARIFGRECVEDLEMRAAEGKKVDQAIEQIGLDFRIATRMTSWVAISEEPTVNPQNPVRRVRIAQQLPYEMSVEGLGLRNASGMMYAVGRAPMDVSAGRFVVSYSKRTFHGNAPSSEAEIRTEPDDTARRLVERVFGRFIEIDGRCISLNDGRMIIEFELDEDFSWQPEDVLVRGARQTRIDLAATTRPGAYKAGQCIRLVLLDVPIRRKRGQFDVIIVRQRDKKNLRITLRTP